jgi:hypothetical protein
MLIHRVIAIELSACGERDQPILQALDFIKGRLFVRIVEHDQPLLSVGSVGLAGASTAKL